MTGFSAKNTPPGAKQSGNIWEILHNLPIFYACCPDMRAVLSFNLLPKPAKNPFNPWLGYWFDMSSNKYLSSLVSRGFTKILYGTLFALIIRNAFVGNRFYIPRAHHFKANSRSGFKVARKRHDIRDTQTAFLPSHVKLPPWKVIFIHTYHSGCFGEVLVTA